MNIPKLENKNEIILVDDDEMEPVFFRHYLKKSKLENPLTAVSSASDFFRHIQAFKDKKKDMPALVLLDIRMRETDGFELLRKIREDSALKDLKVVMFSNSNAASDIEKAERIGADGYYPKPIGTENWLTFLNALVPETA